MPRAFPPWAHGLPAFESAASPGLRPEVRGMRPENEPCSIAENSFVPWVSSQAD